MAVKKILVWKSKHGSSYWDASTPDLLAGAMVDMVQNWIDQDWLAGEDEPLKPPKRKEGHVTGCRCSDCKDYDLDIKTFDKDSKERERLAHAFEDVKDGSASAAKAIAEYYNNWEYLDWSLEDVTIAPLKKVIVPEHLKNKNG